jgi:hypothetical protein
MSSNGQIEHFGPMGVQMFLPKGTNKALISAQYFFGSFDSRARRVASGVGAET